MLHISGNMVVALLPGMRNGAAQVLLKLTSKPFVLVNTCLAHHHLEFEVFVACLFIFQHSLLEAKQLRLEQHAPKMIGGTSVPCLGVTTFRFMRLFDCPILCSLCLLEFADMSAETKCTATNFALANEICNFKSNITSMSKEKERTKDISSTDGRTFGKGRDEFGS